MTMTLERLQVLNERAERVKQLELDFKNGYGGNISPETNAKIDELIQQDLKAQLEVARREFEGA